jgi:hypothetical protein
MTGESHLCGDEAFGEWLHERISEDVHYETKGWALDRARRVTERLQACRPGKPALLVEIPWLDEVVNAFTAPGRYVYLSRRLYERCAKDDQVAFVIAHEMAHHDLGHIDLFSSWMSKIRSLPGSVIFVMAFHALERRIYGPERECDADRYAMALCMEAGYDGAQAMELFDVLELHALDVGDHDALYGPDKSSHHELDENAGWLTKAQLWAWQRKRGYLPIRDRRQLLHKYLERQRMSDAGATLPDTASHA